MTENRIGFKIEADQVRLDREKTIMSDARNGAKDEPAEPLTPRAVDAAGRLIPISDEERRRRLPLELASLEAAWDIPPDETETDEAWDQVMRALGVDPATGRGLAP